MGRSLTTLVRVWLRLRNEPRPLRFLISRLLWATRLGGALRLAIRTPHGALVFSNSAMAANLWVDPRAWESREALRVLLEILRPGDAFVDVGANIGVLSIAGGRSVGPTGCVVSLEPHPGTFKALARNVRANDLGNVDLNRLAAHDRAGVAYITDLRSDDQNRIITDRRGIPVIVAPLDAVCRDLSRIRLLNVDVEGAELAVLQGAPETLLRTDIVLIEVGADTEGEASRHLEERGFCAPRRIRQGPSRCDLLTARDEGVLARLVDSLGIGDAD